MGRQLASVCLPCASATSLFSLVAGKDISVVPSFFFLERFLFFFRSGREKPGFDSGIGQKITPSSDFARLLLRRKKDRGGQNFQKEG